MGRKLAIFVTSLRVDKVSARRVQSVLARNAGTGTSCMMQSLAALTEWNLPSRSDPRRACHVDIIERVLTITHLSHHAISRS